MRIHATSTGLDPAELVPGEDLVLDLEEAHGADAPVGVYGDDYLALEDRRILDTACVAFLLTWRERYDRTLTLDGVCLPFIREWPIFRGVVASMRHAAALQAALAQHSPKSVELAGAAPAVEPLVTAVCDRAGVALTPPGRAAAAEAAARPRYRPEPLVRRLRRLPLEATTALGAPSALRRGSVVVVSYWPLLPLLDHMLSERGWRPAIPLGHLPTGPRRSLRALASGGWIGLPGPRARRNAARRAAAAIAAAAADAPTFDVMDLPISGALHSSILGLLSGAAALDLAHAATVRRAFDRRRVARIVGAADVDPYPRTVISLGRDAGIPTFVLAHGAYLLPQPLVDLEVADEVALWSAAVAPPTINRDRPIHVVGYPLPHDPPATRRHSASHPPRILILGQRGHPYTSTIDGRIDMRQWQTAVGAVEQAFPRATVVLRPHPGQGLEQLERVRRLFPSVDLRFQLTEDIMEVLAGCDLCIGGASAATMQAALVGTPVIVLNLTGLDWPWPIGGDTDVPLADSRETLVGWLESWAARGVTGRESLLGGLGANGGDATGRLVRLLG